MMPSNVKDYTPKIKEPTSLESRVERAELRESPFPSLAGALFGQMSDMVRGFCDNGVKLILGAR